MRHIELEHYLWSAVGNGNGVHQIVFFFFWNLNGETFQARAEAVLARLKWDRVENMSGEMKLTPTFSSLPPHSPRPSLRAQPSSHFLCKVEENIPLTAGMESLQLLSLFIFTHLSSLWFIVPLHSLSGVQCLHFLSLCTHTSMYTCTHSRAFSDIFHFHLLCLFSYFPPRSLFFSPAVVEILDVLACLLSSPHHLWGGSRRVYRPGRVCVEA